MSFNLSGYQPLGARSQAKNPRQNPYFSPRPGGRVGKVGKPSASNSSFSNSFSNSSNNSFRSRTATDASILGDVTINRSLLSNISANGEYQTGAGASRHRTYNPNIRKLVIERKRAPADILLGEAPPMGHARRGDKRDNSILNTPNASMISEYDTFATPSKSFRGAGNATSQSFLHSFDMTTDSVAPYPVNNPASNPPAPTPSRFNGPITTQEGRSLATPSKTAPSNQPPPDYWMLPDLNTLKSYTVEQLKAVDNLNIGRKNFGYISWPSAVDLSTTDLDSILGFIVIFSLRAVVVYADDSNKPVLGQGLNKPAVITLENVSKVDRRGNKLIDPTNPRVIRHRQQLQRSIEGQNGQHLSYDPASGVWVFQVPHFSRWTVPDSDDEDDDEDDQEPEPKPMHSENHQHDIRGARSQQPYTQPPPPVIGGPSARQSRGAASNTHTSASAAPRPAASTSSQPAAVQAAARKAAQAAPTPAAPAAYSFRPNPKAVPGGWNAWQANIDSEEEEEGDEQTESDRSDQDMDEVMEEDTSPDSESPEEDDGEYDMDVAEIQPSEYEDFRQEFSVVNIDSHDRPISTDWLTQLKHSAQSGSPLVPGETGSGAQDMSKAITAGNSEYNLDSMLFGSKLVNVAKEEYTKAAEELRLPSYSQAINGSLAIFQCNGEMAVKLDGENLRINTVSELVPDVKLDDANGNRFLDSIKNDMTISERNNGFPRYTLDYAPNRGELNGTVYSLASILFQSSEALGINSVVGDAHLTKKERVGVEQRFRRQLLSDWLEEAVFEATQKELHHDDPKPEDIVTLLSGNRIDEAALLCLKTNNVHLGTVVSMIGEGGDTRADAQAQLDHWRSSNALGLIPEYVQHVYELAAGNVDVVIKSRKLDWLREFGLRLWYGTGDVTEIKKAIEPITASSPSWDLRLLRLFAGKYNLEKTLSGAAFDTAVPWVLCVFFLQYHAAQAPETADRLTLQYASQLESLGQIPQALLVLGFLVSDTAYAQAVTRFVARNVTALREVDVSSYRISSMLMDQAEALLARYENRPSDEVRSLLSARLWESANDVVVAKVAPQAVIRGDIGVLIDIIGQFQDPAHRVASWKRGGQVYLDYAKFKLGRDIDMTAFATGLAELSASPASSQFETRVAVSVMFDYVSQQLLLNPKDSYKEALQQLNTMKSSSQLKQIVGNTGARFAATYA